MRPAHIFISYRRDDAAGYARAIYDALARVFGADRVFMDVDDIGAGQRFGEVIGLAVGASEVLLVLIGRRWLGERDDGPPRIRDAVDWVRQEVAAGLAQRMRVVPLLLDGAAMPAEAQLPEELRPLAGTNALEIGNTRFAADIERLVGVLREALGEPAGRPSPRPGKATRWGLAGALLVAAALTVLVWQGRLPIPGDRAAAPGRVASDAVAAASTPAARPAVDGEWAADVTYDWPNSRRIERFVFGGDGAELHGSASFLGVPRGVLEGRVEAGGLRFVTRTTGALGASTFETVHRYRGRLVDGEIRFVMQTEGGSSAHVPIEFVARRAGAAAAAAASR